MFNSDMKRWLAVGSLFLIAVFWCFRSAVGQFGGVPTEFLTEELEIVAPVHDSVHDPENPITVILNVHGNYESVAVVGSGLGVSNERFSPPYEFELQSPSRVSRRSTLTALGRRTDGLVLASQSISIQIDPPAAIESLQVVPRQLRFNYPGERVQLRVEGMLADGLAADLSASNRVLFSSEDAQVASVAADGVVTAIGGGTTKLIVSGGGNSVEVPILVASAEPGDLNVDGAVDQHDMNVLLASLGLSGGPFDVRDLNGDGVIDATDVVQYSGMCAPSGCSVPQENVLVPALIGAQRLDAQQKIAQAQLVVGLVTEQYNAVIPPGEVLAQLPSAWASVEFGSAVDLVVALGPAAIVVPDVYLT